VSQWCHHTCHQGCPCECPQTSHNAPLSTLSPSSAPKLPIIADEWSDQWPVTNRVMCEVSEAARPGCCGQSVVRLSGQAQWTDSVAWFSGQTQWSESMVWVSGQTRIGQSYNIMHRLGDCSKEGCSDGYVWHRKQNLHPKTLLMETIPVSVIYCTATWSLVVVLIKMAAICHQQFVSHNHGNNPNNPCWGWQMGTEDCLAITAASKWEKTCVIIPNLAWLSSFMLSLTRP